MFDRCFRCNEPGHTRSQCPQARRPPAVAPAAPATDHKRWLPPAPPQNPHPYPASHYMLTGCCWCGAGLFQRCVNVGTGRELSQPHLSRAAGGMVDARGMLAEPAAG